MRTSIALCMVALVLAAAGPAPKLDTRTVLAEMDKSKFGNTFLSFLSLNSASDVPVDEINQTLDDILEQLQNRQADADAYNATNQAACDETLSNLIGQIGVERDTISSLENAIETNGEIKEQAKRDLNQASTDYDETVAALESGQAQRDAEHAKWEQYDYEHTEAIITIEEASKLIKHMLHGVTFAQIKPRYEKVQEKLKSGQKFGTLFKPLILGLSELATKLNYENVVKILDLLNNILSALRESQTNYANNEHQAEEDWDALSTHLSDQKQALADKKSRLNSLITSTEQILEQSATSLSFHRVQLGRLETAYEAQQKWCDTQSEIYVDETNERTRQTEILERLQEHINDKWGAVADFLQERRKN